MKEQDIEAKLKQVIADWSAHNLAFGNFKTRGELLLRGEDTSEVISLMEDSLMILGSLMSNRLILMYHYIMIIFSCAVGIMLHSRRRYSYGCRSYPIPQILLRIGLLFKISGFILKLCLLVVTLPSSYQRYIPYCYYLWTFTKFVCLSRRKQNVSQILTSHG